MPSEANAETTVVTSPLATSESPEAPVPSRAPESPAAGAAVKDAPAPARPRVDALPPFKLLLHNDDVNTLEHVVESLCTLTPLKPVEAKRVTFEAHRNGVALVLVTHKERAELYHEQFMSKQLTTTIEPA